MCRYMRKLLSLLAIAAMLVVSTITGLVLPVAAEATKTQIDLTGATVTASGAHASYPTGNLIDGKTTTFWSSNPNSYDPNTNAWVQVQLPYATFVDEVRLFPRYVTVDGVAMRRCFPVDFTIQVSSDGVNWTTVVTETDYETTGAEWQVFTFEQQASVQYIKVDATELYTENETAAKLSYRCQFMELEAYYTPLSSVAEYAAAMDAVAIDRQNSCLLYPSIPGITATLKSTTDTNVVDTDGTVDTVNTGTCKVVLTLSDGTTAVDTAPIPVHITGLSEQEAQKITISAASASTEANTQWTAARLINGNKTESSTGWSTKQYKTSVPTTGAEWAMLTLAESAIVKQVHIYPRPRTAYRGMPLDFEIQVSADGAKWVTAYSVEDYPMEANNAMQTIDITPTYGSYVRLWCTELGNDSATSHSVQLAEMEVYGVPASVDTAENAAAALTVKPVETGDTVVDWEGINKKFFKVTLTESSHPSVVALDKSVTLPEIKTEVTLTLTVQNRIDKNDSVAVQRTVTVNSPYGLLVEEAARSIDLLPIPEADAKMMPMPTPDVDDASAFAVTIESSSHPSIVALDGTLTRPAVTTGVRLTLRVTHSKSGEYALTEDLLVPVYKPFVAPTLTAAEIDAQLDKYERSALGVFVHYVPAVTDTKEFGKVITSGTVYADGTKVTEVDDLANNFDAEQFAAEMAAFGADYVLFTAWHADMRPLFPSMTNQRWRDDRRVEDTVGMKSYADHDMIAELLDALEPYGIDLHLYTHPSDGHDLTYEDQELTGWDDAENQYGTWNDYVNELYYELAERYGDRIKGLWFDGHYNHVPVGDPQQRLHDTCLTFNPAMALVRNTGFDQLVNPQPESNGAEYRAWEIVRTDLETLKVSHNQSCMVIGASWFTTAAQDYVPNFTYNTAESVYRYTALMSTISTHGGFAASIAVYPERADEQLDNLWAHGVYDLMVAANDNYLKSVSESVKNVIPSTAYPTAEESTLATLEWGAASESVDGKTLYLHVLKQPEGDTLTLPATADSATLAASGTLLNFDGTMTEGVTLTATEDGYTVALPEGVAWSEVDTVIKVAISRPEAESITLSNSTIEMVPDGVKQLAYTVAPTGANAPSYYWASSDHSVVTVDRKGKLTAHGEGTATVTLTVGELTDTCTVTVCYDANMMSNGDFEGPDPMVDWFILSGTVTEGVGRNGSAGLVKENGAIYLKGQNFTLLPYRHYEFSLYFKGDGSAGNVWYNTGSASNNNGDVTPIVSTRTLSAADAEGFKKYTCILETGANPYLVSNYAIALSGFPDGTIIDDIALRLLPEPQDLQLNVSTLEMRPGTTATLTGVTTPADAYVGGATWSSSNTAVVTVDSAGTLTAVAEGTAVVTAVIGSIERTCLVTVSPYANVIINGDFELGATGEWGGNQDIIEENGNYALTISGSTQGQQYYKGKFFTALEDNTDYLLFLDHKTVGGGYPEIFINYGSAGNQANGSEMVQTTKFRNSNETWQTAVIPFSTGTITHSNVGWELTLIRRVDQNLVDGSAEGTTYFDNLRFDKKNGAYVSNVVNGEVTVSNDTDSGLHLDSVGGTQITVTVTPNEGYILDPNNFCYVTADGTVQRILNKAEGGFGEGDGTQFIFNVPKDTTVAIKANFVSTAQATMSMGTLGTSLYYESGVTDPTGVRFLNRLYIEDLNIAGDTLTVRYQGETHTITEFGSLLKRSENTAELTLETANANLTSVGTARMWKAVAYTTGGNMKLVDYTQSYLDFTVVMKKGTTLSQETFEQRSYTVCGYVVLDDGTVLYTDAMIDSVSAALARYAA